MEAAGGPARKPHPHNKRADSQAGPSFVPLGRNQPAGVGSSVSAGRRLAALLTISVMEKRRVLTFASDLWKGNLTNVALKLTRINQSAPDLISSTRFLVA